MRVVSEHPVRIVSKGNPYLEGLHAPATREIDVDDPEIAGELPRDLEGIYLRNGPSPRHQPPGLYHWFDGDGMLHGAAFRDGKAVFRSRWIRTEALRAEDEAGRAVWPGLLDPPDRRLARAWGSDGWLKDNSNTDVVHHAGRAITTFYQCGDGYVVDPVTLETRGTIDLRGAGARSMSAHAMTDEHTGELMFFDYATKPPYMTYGVLDREGRLAHFTEIDLPGPRLPHTLAITERYTILMDLPLFWDPALLAKDVHKVVFHRNMPSRFGVIPRCGSGAEIRWFEAAPAFIYHVVNAWEDGDEIVLDACRTHTPEPTAETRRRYQGAYGALLAWMRLDATYHRWRFHLRSGETREEPIHDRITEFPAIRTDRLGRKTRYSYHVSFGDADVVELGGLVKYDTEAGTTSEHVFEPGWSGSEPAFAPRTGAAGEDDGYVVTLATNAAANRSEVQVFDARDLAAGPLARVKISERLPAGFHACWVPPRTA